MKEAAIDGGGPLQQGSRIRLKIDRDRFTATVVSLNPNQELKLLVKGPGFLVNHTYTLTPSAENTATVTLTAVYGGIIGSLAGALMKGSVRRDLTDELSAIKQAAEVS